MVDVQNYKKGKIAMMNSDRKIENVFSNQTEATKSIGQCASAMPTAVKQGTILSSKYFKLWDEIDEETKATYTETNIIAKDAVFARSKQVLQIDPTTKVIIKHKSVTDVQKLFKMSPRTIKNAIQDGSIVRGFVWRYAADV